MVTFTDVVLVTTTFSNAILFAVLVFATTQSVLCLSIGSYPDRYCVIFCGDGMLLPTGKHELLI